MWEKPLCGSRGHPSSDTGLLCVLLLTAAILKGCSESFEICTQTALSITRRPYHTRNLPRQICYYTQRAQLCPRLCTHNSHGFCATVALQRELSAAEMEPSPVTAAAGAAKQRDWGCVFKRLRKNKKAASFAKKSYPSGPENCSLTHCMLSSSHNLLLPGWTRKQLK